MTAAVEIIAMDSEELAAMQFDDLKRFATRTGIGFNELDRDQLLARVLKEGMPDE